MSRAFIWGWLAVFGLACACGPSVEPPQGTDAATGTTPEPSSGSDPIDSASDDDATPEPPATSSTSAITTGVADETTAGDESTSEQPDDPPEAPALSRLLVFFTPHGFYRDQGLPVMLDTLEASAMTTLVVEGIHNIAIDPEGIDVEDAHSTSSAGLLTGGLLGSGSQGDDTMFNPHHAGGPSIDVLLGDLSSEDVPIPSTHLGVRASATESLPLGVSYLGYDQPRAPIVDPAEGFETIFADHPGSAELDELEQFLGNVPSEYPAAVLEAQLALALAAFRYDMTRVQLVTVDVAIPALRWFPESPTLHELMVGEDPSSVVSVHYDCATRLGELMFALEEPAVGEEAPLRESTAIVWVSDMGDVPPAHTRGSILVIIMDGSGTFASGEVEVEADQADLAVTLATALGVEIGPFGHPDLAATPIPELLAR